MPIQNIRNKHTLNNEKKFSIMLSDVEDGNNEVLHQSIFKKYDKNYIDKILQKHKEKVEKKLQSPQSKLKEINFQ